ncbi:MAG: cobyrinate a,c-diamide synthase [Pseudobacteriovorax sp.]|nr:cobyrinate a,c-diamide synthase [Pseudobacteriovorax sp.]
MTQISFMIAGLHSGAGKTTLAAGLAAAFRAQGKTVQTFKAGPDYLDPSYLSLASGRDCINLDGWLMGEDIVKDTFKRHSHDVDVAIIEGVMGLLDGANPKELTGSSAEIAMWLGLPVIVSLDISGMARTARLLVAGLKSISEEVNISGVILNQAGSQNHISLIKEAIADQTTVFGGLVCHREKSFPGRHLGLQTARDNSFLEFIHFWRDQIIASGMVTKIENSHLSTKIRSSSLSSPADSKPKVTIAYALDEAFHFYYPENLSMLKESGARLLPFSPVHDEHLPDCDGVMIGGGYPELWADLLDSNTTMKESLRQAAKLGVPIYAECGGLMYLAEQLVSKDSKTHKMLGLVPGTVTVYDRVKAIGYCEAESTRDSIIGPEGTTYRAHQFRYSDFDHTGEKTSLKLSRKRTGHIIPEGYGSENILASYAHAHWASNPQIPKNFIRSCERNQRPWTNAQPS